MRACVSMAQNVRMKRGSGRWRKAWSSGNDENWWLCEKGEDPWEQSVVQALEWSRRNRIWTKSRRDQFSNEFEHEKLCAKMVPMSPPLF